MKTETNRYRIDRSTGTIYEINDEKDTYYFLCTFSQIGATSRNRDKTIEKKIEDWKNFK